MADFGTVQVLFVTAEGVSSATFRSIHGQRLDLARLRG